VRALHKFDAVRPLLAVSVAFLVALGVAGILPPLTGQLGRNSGNAVSTSHAFTGSSHPGLISTHRPAAGRAQCSGAVQFHKRAATSCLPAISCPGADVRLSALRPSVAANRSVADIAYRLRESGCLN
jgi:hypothetical protein